MGARHFSSRYHPVDTSQLSSRAMLSSCAFLRRLVRVGVGAKNLNEDKLVPAGPIR